MQYYAQDIILLLVVFILVYTFTTRILESFEYESKMETLGKIAKAMIERRIMKVYLVYGNTYFDGCGELINTFGVFSTREKAEAVKKQKEDEYFENDQKSYIPELDDRSDVVFEIKELEVDGTMDEFLGGYVE